MTQFKSKDSIVAKLKIAFGFLLAILLGIGWLGTSRLARVNADLQEIVNKRWAKVQLSREALSNSNLNNRITMEIFFLTKREQIEPLLARRAEGSIKISELLHKLEALGAETRRETELLEAVKMNRTPYIESYEQALDLLLNRHEYAQARAMMVGTTLPRLIKYHNSWDAFVEFQGQEMDRVAGRSTINYAGARKEVVFLTVLGMLLAVGIAVFALHSTKREIARREQAETEVVRLNVHLERKVELRTADLARANMDLEKEVAERKRLEEDAEEAKKAAEAASEAKSTFLATMSHELRTPMNGILGMTELVLDTELSIEQRESLGLVRLSAESLLSIINDILDFSKIEAGKLDLESIPFDLRESLGETMKALSYRADQKGVELIYEIQPDVPEAVLGDPGRIRQILINLIGNALKFTERGEIYINVERQSLDAAGVYLSFSVKDSGIGIPLNKQKTIFEAFSQADGSMARRYGGTGLGLTICTKLVEMMSGRIWVESQPGQGSTFFFTVKLKVQESPTPHPVPLPLESLRNLHSLIVDDNFTNRRVLHGMLTRWGMKPTAVESGRVALQALQIAKSTGHPFPLILLDGQMPEMDGFTFAEQLKADPDLAGATIMMLTSAGHLGDAARCRELGISAYLVKPIRQRELLDAICQVLQQSTPKDAAVLVTRHTLHLPKNPSRILLAEDNFVNRTLAVRLLEKHGYSVIVAVNGREAVVAAERDHFDAILMDIQMPEMDGLQATAAIRAKEKSTGQHIPIIAMTAHALKGDQERCLAAGMDDYVSKPIRTVQLLEAIENAIAKKVGAADDRSEPIPASI